MSMIPPVSPPPRRVVKDLPLTRLLPNMLTILSLCSGLTGMRFALQGKFDDAVLAILIAAVFDVLDGRVARMLNIASKFGAELDSLSDAISFGVAPGFVIYEWLLKDGGDVGWIAVLFFAVCTALRLARFNTMLDNHAVPVWAKNYFTGVPAPAGACLALLPLVVMLQFADGGPLPTIPVALWMIVIGGLMVSRVPTLSMKGLRVAPVWIAPIFVIAVLVIAALITDTWLTLSVAGLIYILSLPYGWYTFRQRQKQEGLLNA